METIVMHEILEFLFENNEIHSNMTYKQLSQIVNARFGKTYSKTEISHNVIRYLDGKNFI